MKEPQEPSWWDNFKARAWKMWEGGYVIPPPQPNSKRYLLHYRMIVVSAAHIRELCELIQGC
jgi:hypothetical protein